MRSQLAKFAVPVVLIVLLGAGTGAVTGALGAEATKRKPAIHRVLGVSCKQSRGKWIPAGARARRSKADRAVCTYLAAPYGKHKLAKAHIRRTHAVTCGYLARRWLPGTALASSYFITDGRYGTDYADVAKRSKGSLKRAAVRAEKTYRTRARKHAAVCRALAKPGTPGTGTTATSTTTGSPSTTTTTGGGTGGTGSGSDWPTFGYDAAHSGSGPASTGITAANAAGLVRATVSLDGTVDSAPLYLAGVTVNGAGRNVFIVSTTYGHTEAIDADSGALLWDYTPASLAGLQGSAQVATATPVADPNRQYVYAASPDGYVHKLAVANGSQVWQTSVTKDATREKMDGGLTYAGGAVIVVTGGYIGDAPSYQGHVVTLDPATGAITHLFYALCSNNTALIQPKDCSNSDAAIWGRGGAIVEPNGNILVATGNAPFDGSLNWGDSVLELSPTLSLRHNWTPANQATLNSNDTDIGSTEPALLPAHGSVHYAVQGGKDGILRLLNLDALDGGTGPAGPATGGEIQTINAPGPTDVFSQPAVWTSPAGTTYVYVTDADGTAAFTYGSDNRLAAAWNNSTPGTSPVIAGGLLWIFDEKNGKLDVYDPTKGTLISSLAAAAGHWNSPVVADGRVALPVGGYSSHASTGTLYIWRLP